MGTFGHIYLKLKDSDKGKNFKFDVNKLPKASIRENDIKFTIPKVHIPKKALYMGIYHHFDSVPWLLGKTLLKEYKDYDTILNLLSMGDMSTINLHVTSYRGIRNEICPAKFITRSTKQNVWDEDKNKWKAATMTDANGNLLSKPALLGYYAYLFDGEKWYVSFYEDIDEDNKVHVDWTDLAQEIERLETKFAEQN